MDPLNHYAIGAPVTLKTTIKVAGVLTDPTGNAVTCKVRKPDGTVLSKAATRDSLGAFSAVVTAAENNQEGRWRYRFESSQANAAGAGERSFIVDHSEFA